jgi:hypothetical protein
MQPIRAETPGPTPLQAAASAIRGHEIPADPRNPFAFEWFCVMLSAMGNKDKGKKEVKKAPKPKPKPEPGRRVEVFTPAPSK